MRIHDKDIIYTKELSNAWIRLSRSKMILFDELTEIEISKNKKNFSFVLRSGTILSRIDKPLKKNEFFEIIIDNITMSVLDTATAFSIQIEDENSVLFNVYHGNIVLSDQNKFELITLNKGQSIRFDSITGEMKGHITSIDFDILSKFIFECVEDYAKETSDETNLQESIKQQIEIEDGAITVDELNSSERIDILSSMLHEAEQQLSDNPRSINLSMSTQQSSNINSMPTDIDMLNTTDMISSLLIIFKYNWSETEFKPHIDISWSTDKTTYILWQLYDENGNALNANGRFDSGEGGIFQTQLINISSPTGNNLYPEGYTIRLTPYYFSEQSANFLPLKPIIMELPYFDVTIEQNNNILKPVISTNIGFYFKHSYESLSVTIEDDNIHIRGRLMPLDGTMTPLEIDVSSR